MYIAVAFHTHLKLLLAFTQAEYKGTSWIRSAYQLSSCHPSLYPSEPSAPAPAPSLIPVSADTVTRQVRVARPTLSHALDQRSAAELFCAWDSPAHRALLLSLQCRHAGAYLDTVPVNPYLRLSDGDFINGCHFRLGATGTNPHVPATTCCCGCHIQGRDHAMSCNRLSGSRSRRHDHWKEALSRISARAGCSARTEPSYASLDVAAIGRPGARANIEVTLPPPHGPTLLDISMIHPRCPTYVADASQTRGAAAALRSRHQYKRMRAICTPVTPLCPPASRLTGTSVGPSCDTFVP
jgi:hypothetical protein